MKFFILVAQAFQPVLRASLTPANRFYRACRARRNFGGHRPPYDSGVCHP